MIPSNKSPNLAFSCGSSSGYSTQSLSEFDCLQSNNKLARNDNTSHLLVDSLSTNSSQKSSQNSINNLSTLNVLNPSMLLLNTTNSLISCVRTSTPTQTPNCSLSRIECRPQINFNPTCNSTNQTDYSLHAYPTNYYIFYILGY